MEFVKKEISKFFPKVALNIEFHTYRPQSNIWHLC